jgi:hypothetical protein
MLFMGRILMGETPLSTWYFGVRVQRKLILLIPSPHSITGWSIRITLISSNQGTSPADAYSQFWYPRLENHQFMNHALSLL